ncbi:MAG: hypothetical protein KF734_17365 [Saprospiraceae bacterium]|nr:hypothetical protein [Saprospiraceae bacterium]
MLCLRLFSLIWVGVAVANVLHAQNDKQVIGDPVITPNDIAADAPVLYLIRFQNVGNDTARNVVVRDTLDPRYNPNSFFTLDASHEFQLLGEGGSEVRWYFEHINLPDSASGGPNSIGYILFSVQPYAFVSPGQTILNRACITFDDVSTICTNETIVWVDANSSVTTPTTSEHNWQVVPNPNYGQFEVRPGNLQPVHDAPSTARCWVTDMGGRTVWKGSAENASVAGAQVFLDKPVPGLYLLWVQSEKRLEVERFTVIR